jgi:hypothetical protein
MREARLRASPRHGRAGIFYFLSFYFASDAPGGAATFNLCYGKTALSVSKWNIAVFMEYYPLDTVWISIIREINYFSFIHAAGT